MSNKTPSSSSAPRIVYCPTCHKPVAWTAENPSRPFCSARCQSSDLGAWANEEYRIAQAEPDAGSDE
ncbi:MAG: DNA gyrase inhibitor YacG [Sterolibacterium sp.]|nr:DNA gyrase inhibitor YacG [Sterolibacterium sp.]MBP9800760.1 DNA gyrase inhibitor YacG [Sterolibacterium sp.]